MMHPLRGPRVPATLLLLGPLAAAAPAQTPAPPPAPLARDAALPDGCARHFGPLRDAFSVNQYQGYDQIWSQVAWAPYGWVCAFSSGQDVFGRYFDPSMHPTTNEFKVNTNLTLDIQDEPAVSVGATGHVLFAWSDRAGYDGEQMGIFGRVYDAAGTPLGSEIQINQSWQASQWRPLISPTPTGGWAVAWTGEWDGDSFFRLLDEAGQPLTDDIRVHEYTYDAQVDPSVAVDADGDVFVSFVDFSSHDPSATGLNLYGRAFDATGTPYQASEFLITSWLGDGDQRQPRVAPFQDGFVVVFEDQLGDGSGYGLFARRYDGRGHPIDVEFPVNTTTAGNQVACSVAAQPCGTFLVAWEDYSQGTPRILAQRFDAFARKVGTEIVVAEDPLGRVRPVVAADPTGQHIVFAFDGSIGGWEAVEAFARPYADAYGPLVYCDALVNSQGCLPKIGFQGHPSETDPEPFLITATDVRNANFGLLFYGHETGAAPFYGGTLCIQAFQSRTPLQHSGGGPGQTCNGTFSIDFNAIIRNPAYPGLTAGQTVTAQYIYRDPQAPAGVGLTDALRFAICP
jgi:hypothetical protein